MHLACIVFVTEVTSRKGWASVQPKWGGLRPQTVQAGDGRDRKTSIGIVSNDCFQVKEIVNVRKITFFAAALALSLMVLGGALSGTASAGENHIVKLACSTGNGLVIAMDTSSVPGEVPLQCGACSNSENSCVDCLNALIENGCEFDKDLDALYLDETGAGPAVLYHLFDEDGDCIEDLCEESVN